MVCRQSSSAPDERRRRAEVVRGKEALVPFSRICAAAAGLTLVITIVAVAISAANRSLSREAAKRQQMVNEAVVWDQISTRLTNSLALVAERDHDERIRKLLAAHGVALRPQAAAPAPPSPPVKAK
jgi:hypothetical protein